MLNIIEHDVPAGMIIHVIVGNYATPSIPRSSSGCCDIPDGPSISPRRSSSWLNAVEGYFAKLDHTAPQTRRFPLVVDLDAAINRFIEETI